MGRRGPLPQPKGGKTAVQQGQSPIIAGAQIDPELELITDPLLPPRHLSTAERKEWDNITASLPPGHLRAADASVMELTVKAIIMARLCEKHIAEFAAACKAADARGIERPSTPHHWFRSLNSSSSAVNQFSSKLGLDPASRLRMHGTQVVPAATKFGNLLEGDSVFDEALQLWMTPSATGCIYSRERRHPAVKRH
jgi:P27 family predicted phage terminase small subunit